MKFLSYKQNRFTHTPKRGFTLIETLVSISIFSVSVVALLSITSTGVSSLNYTKNKLTATYLAQEGIEIVRNIRDTTAINNIDPSGWNDFLLEDANDCLGNDGCRTTEPDSMVLVECNNTCPLLRYNTTNGTFSYNQNFPETLFTRTINMRVSSLTPEEVLVTSTVVWSQAGSDFTISVSERLFDWR